MAVTILTNLEQVQVLVPAWRELLAHSDTNEFTLSPEWLLSWWDVFGSLDGRELRFVLVHEGEQLVGLAPLVRRRHWYRPGIPFRRLELLASGEREADAICTDYLTIIARHRYEHEVATAVFRTIIHAKLGPWDELVIPLMIDEQEMTEELIDAGGRYGFLVEREETTRAPFIPLPGSWEEYLRLLGKKERYLINRTMRDFEEWAKGEWSLQQATRETLEEGKRILHALHQERWQGSEGGVFRSSLFLSFHDRVMPLLLQRDSLELLWLIVRGEPVAAMYNVTWNRKTYFYQCGRSLNVPKHLRPGGVLIYLAIRQAIAAGRREFDFLGGEAVYKKQLALASRPLVRLRIAHRRGWRERCRQWLESGKALLRPLKRRWQQRKSIDDHALS